MANATRRSAAVLATKTPGVKGGKGGDGGTDGGVMGSGDGGLGCWSVKKSSNKLAWPHLPDATYISKLRRGNLTYAELRLSNLG